MGTYRMKNSKGFTLLELLFVLTIVSIVSLLILAPMFNTVTKQQSKHLLQTLESDVFLIQNHSLHSASNNRILMNKHHYIVRYEDKNILRTYPNDLQLTSISSRIRFSTNGTILEPQTYLFKDSYEKYKIIFPFGKGRFYIEE